MGCICSRLISPTPDFEVLEKQFAIPCEEITRTEGHIIKPDFEVLERDKLFAIPCKKITRTEEHIIKPDFEVLVLEKQFAIPCKEITRTEEHIIKKKLSKNVDSGLQKPKNSSIEQGTGDINTDEETKKVITNVPKEKLYQKEMEKETYFQVLHDASCLPRFTYHRSLVDWYMEGLPKDIIFTGCHIESCFIIIGGIITDEDNRMLFGETALSERLDIDDLLKEARNHTAFLIVYFFTDNFTKMGEDIEKLDRILPLKHGHEHVLVVMEMECSKDKKNIIEKIMTLGISRVEVVIKRRSEIMQRITCTLEQILSSYLVGTKEILLDHSHTHQVDSSLLEVNAILKRLKQAECYPEPLVGFVEPANNEIDNILQRFPEKILYSVNDGNTQYIIASDHTTKMSLETLFSGSGFKNINFVISVEDKLSISELSKTGVPLHGAKFVYVNMGAEAFSTDECFATTGSLMQANNNSLMVAVTCRHALDKKDSFFTLIENSMVKLGQEVKQPNNKMVRLHDDISVVRIDDATRSIVDEKCEKLLIDTSKLPSPARISDRTLVKGDIVHKRGARTGLTTGIVRDVRTQQIGRFSEQSRVIFITGRDSIPFAEKGDSGSLVFQHSLDPEGKRLEVLAMVQGKVNVPIPNADVICFPFIEGCENLQNNIPDIQNLDFFNH
nr:uncharacterized protein LOC117690335 isoform X3 [Crassostrea gigas]